MLKPLFVDERGKVARRAPRDWQHLFNRSTHANQSSTNSQATMFFNAGFFITVFILLIVYLAYVGAQTRKRKKIQSMLMAAPTTDGTRQFPIRWAGSKGFNSWLKVFPWEGSGVLRLTPAGVELDGATNGGKPLAVRISTDAEAHWVGRAFKNGATAWFKVVDGGEEHYFTSETGNTIANTGRDTQAIFEAVKAHLLAQNLGKPAPLGA